MPKHEPFTPKAIAIRIKSKGLQKLRWYCQMCSKQCRDQNGFKCHLTSESHQRQLLLFSESPGRFMNEFSREFEKCFMDIVRRQYGTKRVKANAVYQQYIKDKNHVHMNATCWYTLSGFVNYLGRTGQCKIDRTEKGWFLQYIDREEEERRAKLAKKQKMDKDDEERIMEMVMKQAQRARTHDESAANCSSSTATVLMKNDDDDSKIEFRLPSTSNVVETSKTSKENVLENKNTKNKTKKRRIDNNDNPSTKKTSLDEIIESEERSKDRKNRKDYWLHEGIVVKIISKKKLEDDDGCCYYGRKGVVEKVEDYYTGCVRILDDDKNELTPLKKFDQTQLETVIPALGKRVLVVNGAYRGLKAILEKLDEKNYCVAIKIDESLARGRIVERVQYEDVCKLYINE